MTNFNKAEAIHHRMLNQFGISKLIELQVYKPLAESLSETDYQDLEDNNIYFNPLFSPASQCDININLNKGAKIITIDINSISQLSAEESIAIILHEVGHSLHPSEKGKNGEFIADDYAKNRGYQTSLVSSLIRCKELWPKEFTKNITEERIARLQ